MDVEANGDTLVVRLEPGEEVIEKLKDLRREHELDGAFFTGIGAVDEAVLGHYDVEEEEYTEERFEGQFEVTNFTGNIGPDKVHAHITLGMRDFEALAGHCSEATVSGTFELLVLKTGVELSHQGDEETGLDVFDL
ncbi:MAG: PPC domain-containing DNA-binding protein [Candidatus Nanohaloarchaea archaeon]|nr:PPC domain-containing DNA-binding protein [Candidatus Nanohaloarchaea archaeon]